MSDEFILDELLEVLQAAQQNDGDGYDDAVRVGVLCQRTGWSNSRVRAQLRELIQDGRVECIRVPYTNISGNRAMVPAYRVIRQDSAE